MKLNRCWRFGDVVTALNYLCELNRSVGVTLHIYKRLTVPTPDVYATKDFRERQMSMLMH